MKRVLLLNTNECEAPYPVPPLGLCLLAESLAGRYEVQVWDGPAMGTDALVDAVRSFCPDYVGMGIRNVDDVVMDGGRFFLEGMRERYVEPVRAATHAPLVLGGSGFTVFAREMLDWFGADFGVVGEGEIVFGALLAALDGGGDGRSVGGVIGPGGWTGQGPREEVDIESLPFARIDCHVDYARYAGRGAYPVQTRRGCAHACIYCSYPALEGRCYRLRSARRVVDEIEEAAQRMGGLTFEIVDSTFNDPPGHAESLCAELAARRLGVRMRTMGVNPGGVTEPLLHAMRQAGFGQIDCTADSGSSAMLASLGKNYRREALERAAVAIRRTGMPTMWFFLLGGPGESEGTLEETRAFVDDFVDSRDMVHVTEGLRVYPGTALWTRAVRDGVVPRDANLLRPRFYVEPSLGADRLRAWVSDAVRDRPNWVRASQATPPPELLAAALRLRREQALTEPMFRTLLRLRAQAHEHRMPGVIGGG